MKQYLKLLSKVFYKGIPSEDRTGTGTRCIFGETLRFDLRQGFPLLTTKKMFWKGIVHELLWMLSGSDKITYLKDNNVHIWDAWADENDYVGPLYGFQWRRWPDKNGEAIDQLANVINLIKTDPYSRRLVVNAWNVGQLEDMALPPCHLLYQFFANPKTKELSLCMYQRSADIFLGLPFDIGLYALLLSLVAQVTGYKPRHLIINLGDVHLYNNHLKQAKIQLSRTPLRRPKLVLNPNIKDINDFKIEDINLKNYSSYSLIKGEVSV